MNRRLRSNPLARLEKEPEPKRDGLTFTPPKDLRKGQALFCFLTWLAQRKEGNVHSAKIVIDTHGFDMDGHFELADTFHIPDEKLDALWNEFVAEAGEGRLPPVSDDDAKPPKPRRAK
jgi:hypothetical protein